MRRYTPTRPVRHGGVRHNLPSFIPPLIGRDRELTQLVALVNDPIGRLVTLIGPGGIGKTHLALAIAEILAKTLEGEVYFVPLSALNTADDIIPAVAEIVGVRSLKVDDKLKQLLDYLHKKNILLVLDNCEHLLTDEVVYNITHLIADLIKTSVDIKILATSREKINLVDEIRFRLSGLDYPKPDEIKNINEIEQFNAVRLFMHGAHKSNPSYTANNKELTFVAKICHLVSGSPLGILLASSWIDQFSAREIYMEIRRNMDFLDTDLRDLPERHRGMRVVFDSTWGQISDKVRDIFMKLLVFRGGFRREAAESAAGADVNTLIVLVNKSLLHRDPHTGRYQMHELLRQYAAEKLYPTGNLNAVRDYHCVYYAEFMQQLESALRSDQFREAQTEIKADFENVRAAWRWALENRDFDIVGQMLVSLEIFCYQQNRLHEGEELFRDARRLLSPELNEKPHPVWSRLLLPWYGLRVVSKGRLKNQEEIMMQAEISLDAARQRGDHPGIALSLILLGALAERRGEFRAAIKYYERCLEVYPDVRDYYWVDADIGLCYRALGQLASAEACYLRMLEWGRDQGNMAHAGWALIDLGEIALIAGQQTRAESCFQEADVLLRGIEDWVGIMWNAANLSLTSYFRGDLKTARNLAEEALLIGEDIDHIYGQREAQVMLGHIQVVEGNYTKARETFQAVLNIDDVTLDAHLGMSLAASGLGEYQSASDSLGLALLFESAYGTPALIRLYFPAAALILADQNEWEKAVELLALAANTSGEPSDWFEKWDLILRLRKNLESRIGSDRYDEIWARARMTELNSGINFLMEIFRDTMSSMQIDLIPHPTGSQPLFEPLSERELQILRLLKSDLTGPEIAQELVISVNTFRYHTKNIYSKLGVNNRRAAVHRADELGM